MDRRDLLDYINELEEYVKEYQDYILCVYKNIDEQKSPPEGGGA